MYEVLPLNCKMLDFELNMSAFKTLRLRADSIRNF